MDGPAALGAGREQIAEPDIRKCSAHHHFVIAAARAVGVEVLRLNAMRDQIFSRGAIGLNRAGRRNVIGGDAIAKNSKRAQAAQI